MTMKRIGKGISVFLGILFALCVAACGGGGSSASSSLKTFLARWSTCRLVKLFSQLIPLSRKAFRNFLYWERTL